jgi:E3 ubiquitin-protein ligase RNF14
VDGLAALWAGGGGGGGGPNPVLWEWGEWVQAEGVAAAVAASGAGCGGGIDLSAAAAAAAAAAAGGAAGGAEGGAEGGGEGGKGREAGEEPGEEEREQDPLAPAAALASDLLRHASAAASAAFAATTHACPICLEEVPGARCVRPGSGPDCGAHALCAPCAVSLVRAALAPGGPGPRACACPWPGCGARLDPAALAGAGLLSGGEVDGWEGAELQAALAAMPDLLPCPHCSTPSLADAGDHLAVCPAPTCRFAFCGLCLGAWHPAAACLGAAARLAVFRARMAGARPTGGQLSELRRREEEYLSAAAIERSGAKRCPGCGAAIQRSEGCNKMACPSCGTRFCYRCGCGIEGYDHFRAGGCVLFEAAELARWERAVGGGGAVMPAGGIGGGFGLRERERGEGGGGLVGGLGLGGGGAQAAGLGAAADRAEAAARNQFWAAVGADGAAGAHAAGPPRLPRCPRCGQGNARVGLNNHLCCFACRGYFCAACGEGLPARGGGLHFGRAPKCQQHS